MSTTPTMVQVRYRFRTDTAAVDSAATWGAAENTTYYPGQETNFRLRFSVNNTGTAAGAGPHILRLSKNAGAYAAITTSSTDGVQSNASASSSADEAAIATANFRLTAGTGTALAGIYDETGSATKSVTNGFYTEFEYGLIIKTANVAGNDTLDFRIYNSTTAYTTYTQTPRITIPAALLANDILSASSVTQPALVVPVDAPSLHNIAFGVPAALHMIELGRQTLVRPPFAYQTESEAIFAAFTTPPDDTRKGLIDDVVVALKAAGVWTKLDFMHVYAAADSQAALINWKAPGTYNGVAVNAPGFTVDEGFTGGSTKIIDPSFNPATASSPNFVQDSGSAFGWSTRDAIANAGMIGNSTTILIVPRWGDGFAYAKSNNTGSNVAVGSGDATGFWNVSRTSSSLTTFYKNGASIGTQATASSAVLSEGISILAGQSAYWNGECAAAGMGAGLTGSDNTAIYNALFAYMDAVGVV